MSMARAVTVIPPTITRLQNNVLRMHVKKRVAAYARVSTNDEEQQTSYEAQIDYYTQHIKANGDWEFVEVYTDVDTPYGQKPNRHKIPLGSR